MKIYAINTCSLLFILTMITLRCAGAAPDPLPSWHNTTNKQAIISFVSAITQKGGDNYVPATHRIASFDMDGTILVEKPQAAVLAFSKHTLTQIAQRNPNLNVQPYQALRKGNINYLQQNMIQVLTAPFTGLSPNQYSDRVTTFAKSVKHPRFNKPYEQMFYQPMLELITYLLANDFHVHIVSGSDQSFVRAMAHPPTTLPYSNMAGAQIQYNFTENGLTRTASYRPLGAVGDGKPKFIQYQIGAKPIVAAGNTAGDQEMFEFTSTHKEYPYLVLWLDHDDPTREYAYEGGVVPRKDWLKISMKEDFTRIFND
jgi:phosphoserine phosphatase